MTTSARLLLILLAAGCRAIDTPTDPPPLVGFDEPVGYLEEPDDEAQRLALPAGGFTGIEVSDARRTLEALMGESEGLVVTGVVENSPGAAAGVEEGDLVLAVITPDGDELWLEWPSQWRELELASAQGDELVLVLDRAGREDERTVVVERRVAPAEREAAPRLREDRRVGLVVRGATEVEARAAGLGPGGGAVIVGLAASSPWRDAGVGFGDLISRVEDRDVDHPQVLLDAIRAAPKHGSLSLTLHRGAERLQVSLPVSRRTRHVRDVAIPLLYRYHARGERRETSMLLGLFQLERTEAAWTVRLLWLFAFSRGDTERLERVQ